VWGLSPEGYGRDSQQLLKVRSPICSHGLSSGSPGGWRRDSVGVGVGDRSGPSGPDCSPAFSS
jgi:hypothetical protein